jgi:hypothetical protein
VKQEIRKWSQQEAKAVLETCLHLDDGSKVRSYIKSQATDQ